MCLYTFSLSEGLRCGILSYWKTNDGDFCPFFEAFFSLTKRARNHRKEGRIFVSLSSDKNRLSNLFSLVFLLKGGCLCIIKAFQKCAQKVCSLFFLSGFSVVYYAQRRPCDREREKDLNASLHIQNLTRCGCVVGCWFE